MEESLIQTFLCCLRFPGRKSLLSRVFVLNVQYSYWKRKETVCTTKEQKKERKSSLKLRQDVEAASEIFNKDDSAVLVPFKSSPEQLALVRHQENSVNVAKSLVGEWKQLSGRRGVENGANHRSDPDLKTLLFCSLDGFENGPISTCLFQLKVTSVH